MPVEIMPTDIRQDLRITVARGEIAETAGFVVDAEFKFAARAGFNEVVREIFGKL